LSIVELIAVEEAMLKKSAERSLATSNGVFATLLRRAVLLSLLCAMIGCSGGGLGAEVSGKVSLDGVSIGPGAVTFAPVGGGENPATGAIQNDGSYFLKTSREEGLRPGKYQVALQIHEIPTDLAPGQRDMRPAKSRIPTKYTDVSTSGLEYDVEPGSNTINLEMTSR
jgi:hypothetical protein